MGSPFDFKFDPVGSDVPFASTLNTLSGLFRRSTGGRLLGYDPISFTGQHDVGLTKEGLSRNTDPFDDMMGVGRDTSRNQQNILDRILRGIPASQRRNQNAGYNAINALENDFDQRLQSVLSNIPVNPFSDELRESQTSDAFATINREAGNLQRNIQQAAIRRGLSSGGSQGTQAATDLGLAKIGQRTGADLALRERQFNTNQAANQYRAGIEADMSKLFTALSGDITGRVQGQNADLERLGNILSMTGIDIAGQEGQTLMDIMGAELDFNIGQEESAKLDELTQQMTEMNKPDEWEKLMDFASLFAELGLFEKGGIGASILGAF